jgi:N-acyl homoserine lactone hydrolase
MKPKTVS